MIKKDFFSKEELENLDLYFSERDIELLLGYDNNYVIKFIDACIEVLGHSLAKEKLADYITYTTLTVGCEFDEEKIDEYDKILELIEYFSFDDFGLAYTLGDYYYNFEDKKNAIKYYQKIFKNGFDLCNENYYDSLVNYLDLIEEKGVEILKELIKFSPKDGLFSLDFINTYLTLIINLEKFSDEYIKYIFEAIDVALVVVREYQKTSSKFTVFSDSPEENDLCELVTLKMEYYVHKGEFLKAFETYKELTDEIGRSDCTRYYHARDKYYKEMLLKMSETYPELKFFEDIGYKSFKVVEKIDDINAYLNKEITLERENGMRFKFVVIRVYDTTDVTIAPILPLLGEGGHIFVRLDRIGGHVVLTNKLSR